MKYAISILRITILSCIVLIAMLCIFDIPMDENVVNASILRCIATKVIAIILFAISGLLYSKWKKEDVLLSLYDGWCGRY